jgi:hypothetical protein
LRDASLYASRFQASPTDRAPPRDGRRGGRRSFLARIFGAKRMGATLILSIAAVAAIGVPMNALFFQDGRHPAPLFSTQPPAPVTAAAPKPPARPAAIEAARLARDEDLTPRRAAKDAIADKIEKLDGGKSADATKSAAAKPETPRTTDKKRDAIGMLLLGEAPRPAASAEKTDRAASEKAASGDKSASVDKNVLYAQRSLLKLGYVVRPDGVLSSATRQALQKFERDSGLPAKGQVTPKLLRQLAERSRLPLP